MKKEVFTLLIILMLLGFTGCESQAKDKSADPISTPRPKSSVRCANGLEKSQQDRFKDVCDVEDCERFKGKEKYSCMDDHHGRVKAKTLE